MVLGLVTADLGAANTFSTSQRGVTQDASGTEGIALYSGFHVSVTGTWEGVLTLQRSSNDGTTWKGVKEYDSSNGTDINDRGMEESRGIIFRLGFKTGNYTSGTANIELRR